MINNNKKRSSLSKAEWSFEREEKYKQMALVIAYDYQFQLKENNSMIYKIDENGETIFCKPDKPSTTWFETRKKLSDELT